MLGFVGSVAALMTDPVMLIGGALAGYLFHADMKKLAWPLLLFILPAVPTVWPIHQEGMFLAGLAQLLAACVIAAAAYWLLEMRKMQPRRAGLDS